MRLDSRRKYWGAIATLITLGTVVATVLFIHLRRLATEKEAFDRLIIQQWEDLLPLLNSDGPERDPGNLIRFSREPSLLTITDRLKGAARPEPHLLRALAVYAMGDLEKSLEILEDVARVYPTYAPGFMYRGVVLDDMGRMEEAEAALETATELAPDSVSARLNLVTHFLSVGKVEDARREVVELRSLQPASPAVINVYGNLLASEGDLKGAEAAYRHALGLEPDVVYRRNLASVLCLLGDSSAAEFELRLVLAGAGAGADGEQRGGVAEAMLMHVVAGQCQ